MLFLVNPIIKEIFQFAEMFCILEAPPQQSQIGLYASPGIRPTALHAHICELGIRHMYCGIYCPRLHLIKPEKKSVAGFTHMISVFTW